MRTGPPKLKPVLEQETLIAELQKTVFDLIDSGVEVMQMDECCFSPKAFKDHGWMYPKAGIELVKKWSDAKLVMVCGLISKESGVVHMETRMKTQTFRAFKAIDIVGIIELLRATWPLKRMAIFLDNASIHKARIVRDASELYRIPLVFNLAYCPHLNGVEQFWGRCKARSLACSGGCKSFP